MRCGFKKAGVLRCGSVRFSDIVNSTVRCGAVIILRCESVRFSEIRNPTVRFGAVFRYRKSYGAVRCCDISYGAVRHGSPLNVFFYGAAPLSVGKTVQHRFFSTVHRVNEPYKTAVSYSSRAFSRGTNETAVFLVFLYGAPY